MRGVPRNRERAVVVTAVLGVAAGVAVVFAFITLANRGGQLSPDDRLFTVGRADVLARAIAEDGPILFPDPLKRSAGRNLYVQHVGRDPDTGWLAFEAQFDDPKCQVVWQPEAEQFRDPCTGDTIPADGGDLRHYPAKAEENKLVVDLRVS